MATHTLITGLEEYVRESFVSILGVFSSCLGLGGEAGGPCCLHLLDPQGPDLEIFVCLVSVFGAGSARCGHHPDKFRISPRAV